jgi:hypothetical protein
LNNELLVLTGFGTAGLGLGLGRPGLDNITGWVDQILAGFVDHWKMMKWSKTEKS